MIKSEKSMHIIDEETDDVCHIWNCAQVWFCLKMMNLADEWEIHLVVIVL